MISAPTSGVMNGREYYISGRFVGLIAVVLVVSIYTCSWPAKDDSMLFFGFHGVPVTKTTALKDELETVLESAANGNKTMIISVLNKAHAEENGLLDLFLQSLREGENTEFLIRHLLLVAADQTAFNRCRVLELHCYQLNTTGATNFSKELLYMSEGYIELMWLKTQFLRDVLRHGYSFIFTDMDILWLRNPFERLNYSEDLQTSCDEFNGEPFDDSNIINTGFFFVSSNNKTIALFDELYGARNISKGMKAQDVLNDMKYRGVFTRLDMKPRFLDTEYFSGFCQDSKDFKKVTTVHANCCRMIKAKIADLRAVFEAWKRYNGTSNLIWPAHKACYESWQTMPAPQEELEIALQDASMANKTLIISAVNQAYTEENGLLDLFLRSLKERDDTRSLIEHLLIVALDQTAFNRCKLLNLHCFQLNKSGTNFIKEQIYMTDGFIDMMWQRNRILGDVLKLGYSFIFTDMDVLWLKNPFAVLNNYSEDMQISCDKFNGQPLNTSNPINTGFFFVASSNKTIVLFDEWYASRNNSKGMKEQDVLDMMKYQGAFQRLGMKVRYLDTEYFSGFCEDSKDPEKVTTVHANCCRSVRAKLADLTAVLETSKSFNGTTITWPDHTACHESWTTDIIT